MQGPCRGHEGATKGHANGCPFGILVSNGQVEAVRAIIRCTHLHSCDLSCRGTPTRGTVAPPLVGPVLPWQPSTAANSTLTFSPLVFAALLLPPFLAPSIPALLFVFAPAVGGAQGACGINGSSRAEGLGGGVPVRHALMGGEL